MQKQKILLPALILFSAFLFSACGAKKNNQTATPTPTPRLIELKPQDKPYISLTPRADGHLLTLKIDRIPTDFVEIEYELIYTAVDQGNEIEKGLGDTLKVDSSSIQRELLLGTESCTNGCKYKYDEGITGGSIVLTLISKDDQVTTYESDFTLTSSSQIKKSGKLVLPSANLEISATPANTSEFFVLFKNYGIPFGSNAKEVYSVFGSVGGKGTVKSISPDTVTKQDLKTISGDYLIN
jgi:hypothetical protein